MKKMTVIAVASLLTWPAWGQAITTNTVSLSPGAGIADGNVVGLTENFSVSGLSGPISNIQVSLDISGGFNGDLYAYLVSPQGQFAVLLNRPGISGSNPFGYGDAGFVITLAGEASSNIHYYGSSYGVNGSGQVTGTWAADGLNIDPQSAGSVFSGTTPTAGLNVFNGLNGGTLNGTWTLFIADLSAGGGSATLNQAILSIMTVPEPQTGVILGVFGMLLAGGARVRRLWRKKC